MFRFFTIRRLLRGAGFVLVFSGLSLVVVHTGGVRRLALAQLQSRLGNTMGLVIHAKELDYNLLLSRFELKELVIRARQSRDMPAPLHAQRLVVAIPLWRLLNGSFETARIQVDGLAVYWMSTAGGLNNWPAIQSGGGGKGGGPAILVTGGSVTVQDDRNGYRLQLPIGKLSAAWVPAKSGYAILCDSAGGVLQWKGSPLPLDLVHLKSSIGIGGIAVESLRLVSPHSEAEISGAVQGSPSRIEASARLNLDMREVGGILALATPVRGRLLMHVSASGPAQAPQITAGLEGAAIVVGGVSIGRPTAAALVDTAAGEVKLRELSAGLFSGALRASGRLSLTDEGRSEFTASLNGLDLRQAGRTFGYANAPAARASVQIRASGRGMDWRRSVVSGVARLQSAEAAFRATGAGGSFRASVDSSLGHSGTMHGDMTFRLADASVSGTVSGTIDSMARFGAEVDNLLGRPNGAGTAALDGAVEWSGTLNVTKHLPSASLRVEVRNLSAGKITGAGLEVQADYTPDGIEIAGARLAWAGQQIDLKGEIGGLSADAPLRLEGTVEGPSLAKIFEGLGTAPAADGSLAGKIRISGSISDPVAEANLHGDGLTAFGQSFAQGSLDARWQGSELTVSRLTADQESEPGAPGRIEASGSFNVSTGKYEIDATAQNIHPAGVTLPGDVPLSGTFRLEAHGKGSLSEPGFSAEISGAGITAGATAVGEVHAKLDAAGNRATALLHVPVLNAKASSTILLDGAYPFDLTLDARQDRTGAIPGASFDASIRAAGTLVQPKVETIAASIRNLKLETGGETIAGDGPIELSYADGRVRVGQLAVKSGASTLRLSGELPVEDGGPPGSVSLQGTVDLASALKLLPGSFDAQVGGVVDVNASIEGSAQNWQPAGSLTLREGRFRSKAVPLPFEEIAGRINFENGMVRLNDLIGKMGSGTVRAHGAVPYTLISKALPASAASAGQPGRFSAQAEKLQFAGGTGAHAASVIVDANVEAEASAFSLDALRATVELNNLEIKAKDTVVEQASPTRIEVAENVAHLRQFELHGAGSTLKASGSLDLTGSFPLDLKAAGQTDLAVFAALVPSIEAAGKVRLDVRVGGTLKEPQTTGFVELDGAGLALANPSLQAGNVKLRADLEADRVTLKEFTGNLNGGTFQGGGELKLSSAGIHDVNLFLKGKDIFAEFPTSVKTTSSLDAKLVSRQERLVLEGRIEIQEGYDESALDLFAKSEPDLDTGAGDASNAPANPVGLDLRIVTKRPVEMDNNLGRISATADLRVAGTVQQPRLTGALQLEEDGRLYFGNRTYYIERGTVRFLDAAKVTPELNIRAYTRTGDYTIKLGLTGQVSEITTTFTSDPPLSRDDVIAVLLTGKTVAENRGVDLRALEATSLATGALNASLSSQVHRSVGVSRVSIQPGAVAAESDPGARVTITQDFTRSFRLLYSMNLSDSNDQIWVSEYDLSRRFVTRAVKQSDNTYRGEFRHDIQFGSSSEDATSAAIHAAKRKISRVRFTGTAPFSPEQLAQVFKVKAGQPYKAMKVRKKAERLSDFFTSQGYLESRVRLDRQDDGQDVDLTVRVEPGPVVELAYRGASLPGRQKSRLRALWHAGISDQQRPQALKEAILGYFAGKGYLQAQTDFRISSEAGRKIVQFDLNPGVQFHGVKIAVEGADRSRAGEILSLVQQRTLKQSVYRDPARAIQAITAYYRQRGYLAAKVSPPVHHLEAERRTGQIVIPIEEGRPYRVGGLRFSGNRALTAADLEDGLTLKTGAVFEPARLEPALSALKSKYGKLGYREPRIEYAIARHDDGASVDVSFTIVENQQTSIGAIKIEGNRRTSEDYARRQLRVDEGQVANSELVRESVKNLSQTGAYTSADIQIHPVIEPGASDKQVRVADLVVDVAEPKPFRLLYGGLYDSGNGPGFIADLQNRNSVGAGRVLGLRARVDSETDEARLYLTQPTWRTRRLSTTFSTYYTRETEVYQTTPTQKLGVSIQQDLQLRSKLLITYGYRYEKQRGFVPDPAAPVIPESVVTVSPVTLTFSRDGRDSFLDATHGSFISHGFEFAPGFLGSDYPYLRYYGQYFKYFSLTSPRPVPFGEKPQPSRLVFATGSRIGMQKGFNSTGAVLTDRFYAGGGTTVRGFRQDELGPKLANGEPAGGNAVLVLNEELRYPLFWIFDAVSFVDVGNIFPRLSDFRVKDLRAAGGFGLRIRNPFVVLRFDYGFKFGRRPGETIGAFFFSIGQAF